MQPKVQKNILWKFQRQEIKGTISFDPAKLVILSTTRETGGKNIKHPFSSRAF